MIRTEVNYQPPRFLASELNPRPLETKALEPELIKAATKARLGGHAVFVAALPAGGDSGGDVVHIAFRALDMKEFDAYARAATLGDVTEMVIEASMVYPQVGNFDDHVLARVLPGAFEELSNYIIECSGFESRQAIGSAYRMGQQSTSNIYSAAHMFIMRAMPGVSPDELRRMDMVNLFHHVAMAEQMLATEDGPMRFPIREMLSGRPQQQKTTRLPNFDELPTLHPHQVAAMRSRNVREYTLEKTRQMRMAQSDPRKQAERRKAMIMKKRRQIAEQRAADSESSALARQFGRPHG